MQNILLTGGGGYIGTNVALKLLKKNYRVFVVDNFSNSKKKYLNSLKKIYGCSLVIFNFDLTDRKKLTKLFKNYKIDAVIHLAGKKYVAQSFIIPNEYKKQNVDVTKQLLSVMECHKINKLIFSSSITVYGKPQKVPVLETEKTNPISPYAKNKLCCEKLILNWHKKTGFGATILRLSNPIGANCEYLLGDDAKTKKYIGVVPYIIKSINDGVEMIFNGNNHKTRDGTTIRDYIHVEDVANAFVNALECCKNNYEIYNIGFGEQGTSVLEILKEAERQLGVKSKYKFGPKRNGDVAKFISQTNKAKKEINFKINYDLIEMIKSHICFINNNGGR